jgi:hypothetical protein
MFFASFAVIAKEQAGKLQREYPHDLSKQCGASGDGNTTVTLQGCKLPIRVLNLRLNVAGQCIEIDESTRVSRDRIVPGGFDKVQIKVNDEEELEAYFRGVRCLAPEDLAQRLIRYVRGF